MEIFNLDKELHSINTFGGWLIGIAIFILFLKGFLRSQIFNFDKYDFYLFLIIMFTLFVLFIINYSEL